MTRGAGALASALLLTFWLVGCTSGGGSDSLAEAVRPLVLARAPAGFKVAVDGSLDLNAAAPATPADPALTRTQLRTDGFRTGWARNWSLGNENVELLVFQLSDQFGAADFARFEVGAMSRRVTVTTFPDADVPGATAFTFAGNTRSGARQVFCTGVWFQVGEYAFEVTDCADTPRFPQLALQVARDQYVMAARSLGVPVASPAPSPL